MTARQRVNNRRSSETGARADQRRDKERRQRQRRHAKQRHVAQRIERSTGRAVVMGREERCRRQSDHQVEDHQVEQGAGADRLLDRK